MQRAPASPVEPMLDRRFADLTFETDPLSGETVTGSCGKKRKMLQSVRMRIASLDDARQGFAMAWGRFVKEMSPERLERACDSARAAESRQQRLEAA